MISNRNVVAFVTVHRWLDLFDVEGLKQFSDFEVCFVYLQDFDVLPVDGVVWVFSDMVGDCRFGIPSSDRSLVFFKSVCEGS